MVGLQVVWGGDAYFLPSIMLRDSAIRTTADLMMTGYKGELARREDFLRPFKSIGEALPEDAKLLLHEHCPRLGLRAPIVNDFPGFQTLISYQDLDSPRAVYDLYTSLGITHLVHQDGY